MHAKNNNALFNYKNINFTIITHTNIDLIDLTQFDCVYSPSQQIDVSKYPNIKFIFGPHFSVFPEKNKMDIISKSKNTVYIQPSEWARDIWKNNPLCYNIRIVSLPFGVDTDKFIDIKNINEKNTVIVYFKRRNPNELKFLITFLNEQKVNFRIFNYVKRYDEKDYLNYLQNSKYGIWLGAHESQGFALEEALSCNVPLLVWNVSSMDQEYGSNYNYIPATTIPYWDYRCGEYFYNLNEFESVFSKFILNLNNYKPREFILENLSIDVCENKLINLINNL
jgi:hypothetical protein